MDPGIKSVASPYQLKNQKILVTGASGFIGSRLCHRLCQNGLEVYAISREKLPNAKSNIHWQQGNLAEIELVQDLLASIKPDVIFHLAGHPSGSRDLELVMPTFSSNLSTTVNLLTAAVKIGCRRIVIAGSQEEPTQDNPESVPCSPYAAGKWASSMYARMFYALYRLPVVILRVFMVYGPADLHFPRLIPYMILSLLRGEAPKLSSGNRDIDWVYVEDVVDGFLAAALAVNVEGQTIDIGSGAMVSVRAIVEHLVRLINPQIEPLFNAIPDRPFEQIRVADVNKSQAMIGWSPRTTLEEGLRRTVHWYERRMREGAL